VYVSVQENTSWPFSSLSRQIGLNATHAVYKLFSSAPMEPAALDMLFTSWRLIDSRDWKAYPRFHPPEVRRQTDTERLYISLRAQGKADL
jgi:hypothetical protein